MREALSELAEPYATRTAVHAVSGPPADTDPVETDDTQRLRELAEIARVADNPALTVHGLAEMDGLARLAGIDWKPEALRDFAVELKDRHSGTEQPQPEQPPAEPTSGTQPPQAPEPGAVVAGPVTVVASVSGPDRRPVTWPVLILCLPAFVAIWAGWVEMGRLTGFGKVALLPGIADSLRLDTAITLPIGVETYAAYALFVWLSGRVTGDARAFAKWSAIASLGLGGLGQVAYHLMAAAQWSSAPWPITAAVACIPVAVLGMGAALAHLMHQNR